MSTGFPWPVFLMTSGATYPKEPARGELFVGGVEEFGSVKR